MEKLVVIPCQAKSAPIGEKMNRGRPPAAKKALQRQDPVQPTTSAAITTTVVPKIKAKRKATESADTEKPVATKRAATKSAAAQQATRKSAN